MFIYLSRKHDRETRKAADIWEQIHEFAKYLMQCGSDR